MNYKRIITLSMIVVLLFIISCTPSQKEETIQQVEPSQVVPPQLDKGVRTIPVQGNSETTFLADIMNQMVIRLKGKPL